MSEQNEKDLAYLRGVKSMLTDRLKEVDGLISKLEGKAGDEWLLNVILGPTPNVFSTKEQTK